VSAAYTPWILHEPLYQSSDTLAVSLRSVRALLRVLYSIDVPRAETGVRDDPGVKGDARPYHRTPVRAARLRGRPPYVAVMAGDPSFVIPRHPERTYPYSGGVEYKGETIFRLIPSGDRSNRDLDSLVVTVLERGPYRYGDFLNLPMPLYLVRDEETRDVFRLSVRDGEIRLHVLPDTGSDGLRAIYERIDNRTDAGWRVSCETSE